MARLNDAFTAVAGREPTDREIQRLLQIQKELDIRDNDALMTALFALEHYTTLYDAIPDRISATMEDATSHARVRAQAVLNEAIAGAVPRLTDAVIDTAEEMAGYRARKKQAQWIMVAVTVCALGVLASVTVGYWIGSKDVATERQAAYLAGAQSNLDAQALAAWGNTREGQIGYRLARSGSLAMLGSCSGAGWQRKDGWCFPTAKDDGTVTPWPLR